MNRVFLAGEGPTELGGWSRESSCRTADPGVLHALCSKVGGDFEIVGALPWKRLRKFQAHPENEADEAHRDGRNVQRLVLHAEESGATIIVFTRDQDGEEVRESSIEEAISRAAERSHLSIAGGVPIRCMECWMLALRGERRTERHKTSKAALSAQRVNSVEDMVQVVETAKLADVPQDAVSLRTFLARLRAAFEERS